eukprot:TRINITY_DN2160_c0_g1_i7.p1 TRINITY_DN2160_c0_g1~~TRINITY_DN2160_c0_g1_i7.p1  ORF type:complete len:376 (-),score=75.38 TRINITY_DN2160_c0_g1_i7:10-1137(-)
MKEHMSSFRGRSWLLLLQGCTQQKPGEYSYRFCQDGLFRLGEGCDSTCSSCSRISTEPNCQKSADGIYRGYICPEVVTPKMVGFIDGSALSLTPRSGPPSAETCVNWGQAVVIHNVESAFGCRYNNMRMCVEDVLIERSYQDQECAGEPDFRGPALVGCGYPNDLFFGPEVVISCDFKSIFPESKPAGERREIKFGGHVHEAGEEHDHEVKEVEGHDHEVKEVDGHDHEVKEVEGHAHEVKEVEEHAREVQEVEGHADGVGEGKIEEVEAKSGESEDNEKSEEGEAGEVLKEESAKDGEEPANALQAAENSGGDSEGANSNAGSALAGEAANPDKPKSVVVDSSEDEPDRDEPATSLALVLTSTALALAVAAALA